MTIRILIGDCRKRLKEFPDNYFHCVVTSWPYWGLRDYDIEPTIWGRDPECEHMWGQEGIIHIGGQIDDTKGIRAGRSNIPVQNAVRDRATGQFCQLCGAWLGNFGLEPTPELYIQHGVEISREVRRVLRDDGTHWLNLGDCYAGSWGNYGAREGKQRSRIAERWHRRAYEDPRKGWDGLPPTANVPGLKPKDLVGIPWMAAFALRDDGWYLRSAIPWIKDNPMPGSQDDRPTTSHEYIFLFSKRKRYYYDKVAIFEPVKESTIRRERTGYNHAFASQFKGSPTDKRHPDGKVLDKVSDPAGRNRRTADWWYDSLDLLIEQAREYLLHLEHIKDQGGMLLDPEGQPMGLMVNPEGFKGDHYATFPTRLVEPCLKASTSERGACPQCGAPWERVIEQSNSLKALSQSRRDAPSYKKGTLTKGKTFCSKTPGVSSAYKTIGWRPTCTCYDDRYRSEFPKARSARKRWQQDVANRWWPRVRKRLGKDDWPTVPCRALDHMGGAGTTAMVADRLGLDAVSIDIKPEYGKMTYDRIVEDAGPLFAQVILEQYT